MAESFIDVDFHFSEPPDMVETYFDEPWRTRLEDGGRYTRVNFYPSSTGDHHMSGRIQRDDYPGMEVEDIGDAMDRFGFESVLALSDLALTTQGLQSDDERGIVISNALVDFMTDEVLDPDAGIYSAIPVSYRHPDAAVELIERAADHPGFVGVYLVAGAAEPPLGNYRYEPIYETAAENDLPLLIHSSGSGLDEFHVKGFEEVIETHSLNFMETNMEQLTSLVIQGIPEKFPELDFVFLESGLYWVAAMMERLDAEYLKRQSEAPLLTRRPSEYMKESFYFGTQPLEQPRDPSHLEAIFDMIGGPDRIMYASDYPHWDYDEPATILELPFLDAEEKRQILSTNAKEVFGI